MMQLPDRQPTLRVKTRPNDANAQGDIFGGWLMSQIDVAGGIAAAESTKGPVATIAVKELTLIKPLFVYDLVSFYAEVTKTGTTSVTVQVTTYAQRWSELPKVQIDKISDATLVFVAIQKPGVKRVIG